MICPQCQEDKHERHFRFSNGTICSFCFEKDKKKRKKLVRRHNDLVKVYDLTLLGYNELFAAQEGRCKICGKHQSELSTALCVDHSHKTGQIRGLLCSNCNTGIGLLGDTSGNCFNAFKYLEEYE